MKTLLIVPAMADFSMDTWWITLIKAVFILVALLTSVLMALWVERRGLGRMQTRLGPNVHGPFGLFQAIADAVKLLTKEDFWKSNVDRFVYILGPVISATTAFMIWAVLPLGPDLVIGDFHTPMQMTDFPVSVLYVLAVSSLGIYGIILGGWASNSTLSLLGATRSAAQVISYELAMGLSLVSVFIMSGSMSTSEIVAAQGSIWWCFALFPAFVIYLVSMVGEVNRLPFDLPECEGEIVAGHETEYSSMKFAWYYLAEYVNMFNVSLVAVTLFLGGWQLPFIDGLGSLEDSWVGAVVGMIIVLVKVWILFFCFVWVRGTLVRYRYDQFMALGWKVLIPVALVWLAIVAVMRTVSVYSVLTPIQMVIGIVVVFVVALILIWVSGIRQEHAYAAEQAALAAEMAKPFDAFAGGYPVPPMPGQQLPPSPRGGSADDGDDAEPELQEITQGGAR